MIFFISFNKCFAVDAKTIALCNLDRTVESFDPQTWLSAKTRSLADMIPISFNKDTINLGIGDNIDTYKNISNDAVRNSNSFINLYKHPKNGTAILLSSTKQNTVIIFAKSEMGPYFLGTCELK